MFDYRRVDPRKGTETCIMQYSECWQGGLVINLSCHSSLSMGHQMGISKGVSKVLKRFARMDRCHINDNDYQCLFG